MLFTQLTANVSYSSSNLLAALAAANPKVKPAPAANPIKIPAKIVGERSLWAEAAEKDTMSNTKEVFPGLYVAGMAANATFGSYRMGPIFGGMLLSGEKVAAMITEELKRK